MNQNLSHWRFESLKFEGRKMLHLTFNLHGSAFPTQKRKHILFITYFSFIVIRNQFWALLLKNIKEEIKWWDINIKLYVYRNIKVKCTILSSLCTCKTLKLKERNDHRSSVFVTKQIIFFPVTLYNLLKPGQ